MKYRADIDGLRAIAILFVLFFHSGLSFLPSGFIGVDIFFVISGYLITGIIIEGLKKQQFSFIAFYNRRLWRLQPVLICLLVVATLASFYFLLPDDLLLFSKSARKTSLFLSNQYFETVTTGYFAKDSMQLPLLNTWSLAIEWQCYLCLPLLLYVLYQIFNKNFSILIYCLTLIAIIISFYFSSHEPTKTYYLFSSRLFEFLIGASFYLAPQYRLKPYLVEVFALIGFVALFYVATKKDISLGFPNSYALLLCLTTGFILTIGKLEHPTLVTRLLSQKPFVFVGLISYSLYIWHWPFFVFIRYQEISLSSFLWGFVIALVFILAYLSWRFIEKPARQYHKHTLAFTLSSLVILPFVLMHVMDYVVKGDEGLPQRFPDILVVNKALKQFENKNRSLCLREEHKIDNSHCYLGSKVQDSQKAFMIGDSFANHYWGFMDPLAKEANISILSEATVACLSLPHIYQYDWYAKNEIYQVCYKETLRYYKMIKNNHYDYVILGQNWNGYLGNKIINKLNDERSQALTLVRIEQALDESLKLISQSGAKPVLIQPSAYINRNLNTCFYKHMKLHKNYDPKDCDFDRAIKEEEWLQALFAKMKIKYPKLIIIDPKKIQCSNNHCRAALNGIPVFRDREHLTDYAAYHFGQAYLKQYKNPFLTS